MEPQKILEKTSPFSALISVSTLLAALLYVAGFSYRWSYYYNFGVQHVVYKLNFQSFLITAIELIRTPRNLMLFLAYIVVPVFILNLILGILRTTAKYDKTVGKIIASSMRVVGLESQLGVDLLRAAIIVYSIYIFSSRLGYESFKAHVVNSYDNPLPAVTVVINDKGHELALSCGAKSKYGFQLIGDAKKIRIIQDAFRTCSSDAITWRLLYRDSDSIFLFASEPAEMAKGKRPLTLIVPNSNNVFLIME
jgi:hypothetical protein